MSDKLLMDIGYKKYGYGDQALVLIHGFGGKPSDWYDFIPSLEDSFTIYIFNIRPFFTSKRPISFNQQVQMLADVIKSSVTESYVHVAGMSYGGTLTMALYLRLKPLVQRVTLINPMPPCMKKELKSKGLKALLKLVKSKRAFDILFNNPFGYYYLQKLGSIFLIDTSKSMNYRKLLLMKKAVARFCWIMNHFDFVRFKKNLLHHAPIHGDLVYASHDELYKIEVYKKMSQDLGMRSFEIRGAGHMSALTHAEPIIKLILSSKPQSLRHSRSS